MIRRRYQCPECLYEFNYDHHPTIAADPAPRFCAKCGLDTEGDYDPALVMPHIGRPIKGIVDNQHRAMEDGAEFRAEMARETMGLDQEGANAMKLTNMKDNLREGDTSDMPARNDVTQIMEAAPQGMFGFQQAAGLGYSASVSDGQYPNAGARAMQQVRAQHGQRVAASGHAAQVVSSTPGLETQQPGYRKRV